MKSFILTLSTWTFIGIAVFNQGCSRMAPSPDDRKLKAALNSFIGDWHKHAAESEHAKYIGAMAEGGIYIGTDATEYWTTGEFSKWSKPYFEKGKGWNLQSVKRNIYIGDDGQTAWFDELLDTNMGLCRGSGVLQKSEGHWKICHYVLSPTVPNELTKIVKALKGRQDSLLMKNLSDLSAR